MDRYAVFGNPIKHSKSPMIHSLFARQTGETISYEAIEAPLDGFESAIRQFFAEGGKGANVTVPFKEQAFALCTSLSERAKLAGAVNTLKLLDDGGIHGDNTDGYGLVSDLLRHHVTLNQARILLLGAGGAARGALVALLEQQPAQITIANRTASKAQQLAELFGQKVAISACGLDEITGQFDVIINSTAASLGGQAVSVPHPCFSSHTVCYDMMYGAQPTVFLQWAKEQGMAKGIDGLGMLVGQASESFAVWRGVRPGVPAVIREIRRAITL